MKKYKTTWVLVFLLGLFIIFDIFLILYFLNSNDRFFLPKLKNSVPFLGKIFISKNPVYAKIEKGGLIVVKGKPKIPSFSSATFKALVTKDIYYDSSSKQFILPIKIILKGGKIESNLVLGANQKELPVYLAKKGNIDSNNEWTLYQVSDLDKLIDRGTALITTITYELETEKYIRYCNEDIKCKKSLEEIKKYANNANIVFTKKSSKNKFDPLSLGPVQKLIIYYE